MEKRLLGKTDMLVSVIGFGSYKMTRKPGGSTIKEVERLLGSVVDAGVNVIDTAECYGESEELLGRARGHHRGNLYVFTKCGHAAGFDLPDWSPRLLEHSIERSLQRLRTDHLDLVQLHSCSRQLLQQGEVIEVLKRARDAGKTRYLGYSGDWQAALFAIQCGAFDVLQTSVNLADQESIELTLPQAKARQMGVIAKRSLANTAWKSRQDPSDSAVAIYSQRLDRLNYDFLRGSLDAATSMALRFTLSVPGVDMALIGSTSPEHWQHNTALLAAGSGSLSQAEFEAIRGRWKRVTWWRHSVPKRHMGWHGWV
jgi:aryl-alcohol dehydrogenase-like predicted oxidoreductase